MKILRNSKERLILQRLVKAVSCIGGIRPPAVYLVEDDPSFIARAEKGKIYINRKGELLDGCTPEEAALYKIGLTGHELGHHLYTDMVRAFGYALDPNVRKDALLDREMLRYPWYKENASEFLEKVSPTTALRAHNSIEDAYIEEALAAFLPKSPMVLALRKMRRKAFAASPTIRELEEKQNEGAATQAAVALLHSYATSGRIRVEDMSEYDLPLYRDLKPLFPLVDRAIEGFDTIDRMRKTMTIWIWLAANGYSDIHDETVAAGLPAPNNQGTEGNQKQTVRRSSTSTGKPSDPSQPGKEKPQQEKPAEGSSPAHSNSSAASTAPSQNGEAEQKEEENRETPAPEEEKKSSGTSEGKDEEAKSKSGAESEEKEPEEGEGECETPAEEEREEGQSQSQNGDSESSEKTQSETRGVGYSPSEHETHETDMDALMEKIQELIEADSEADVAEEEDDDEYRDQIRLLSGDEKPKENIHAGIQCREKKIGATLQSKEAYRKIAPSIQKLVLRTYRPIEKAVKSYLSGNVRNGLYYGKKLNTKGLYRKDLRFFRDNKREEKDLDTAVSVLVDQSGSMSGDKIEAAIAMSLVMSGLTEKLKIPCAIYGHDTCGERVDLCVYQQFDRARPESITQMTSGGSNRDGYALRVVGSRLLQRPEIKKVLILVCDGQPAHLGYHGDDAYNDLRAYQRELQRKGVHLIVAAIDNDKEQIKRIYGSAFMSVSNLNRLAELLANRLIRMTGLDQI